MEDMNTTQTVSDDFVSALNGEETFEDNLFDDPSEDTDQGAEVSEEIEEDSEETTDKETAGGKDETAEEEKSFNLRYNHQDVVLKESEMIALAQKGLDYDRVQMQRDSLRNDPTLLQLEDMAAAYGMNKDDFLSYVDNALNQSRINSLAYQLMESRGLDEQTAYDMANLQLENEQKGRRDQLESRRQQAQFIRQQEAQRAKQQEDGRVIESFERMYKAFPELSGKTFDDLPQSVRDQIIGGASPLEAYQSFVIAENKKQMEIIKNNNKVKERSTGTARSLKSSEKDSFLEAFLS